MKKSILILTICLGLLLFASTAGAHELWIETEHRVTDNELRVDITWGHIYDVYDPSKHEDMELFVRYPDGQVEELELQQAGVQSRAYLPLKEEGEYVFWASRKPSIYAPEGAPARLSMQMAKTVFVYGEGSATSTEATELPLEIIPESEVASIADGTFNATAFLDGEPVAGAAVAAYGPNNVDLMGETAADGTFSFSIPSPGIWLVRVSATVDEEGELEGGTYTQVGRTSTLVFEIPEATDSTVVSATVSGVNEPAASSGGSNTNMIIGLVIGLLLGAAAGMFFAKKKSASA